MSKTDQKKQAADPGTLAPVPPQDDAESGASEAVLSLDRDTVTPGQFEELKSRAARADEYWERLLRTTADFDNFKKRAGRERQDAVKFANETLIQKLLTVLDSFEMALATAPSGAADGLQAGIAMTQQQLRNVLAEAGLEEVDAGGQAFDPNLHEAVSQQETDTVPEGHVAQQLRRGYKLRERLLRPASVVVAKKPAAA